MDVLINDIFNEIKDYRKDEIKSLDSITKEGILAWINQFEVDDRKLILMELNNILKKSYITLDDAYEFYETIIKKLSKEFEYFETKDFLFNLVILDINRNNKTKVTLYNVLKKVLKEKFNFNIEDCGSKVKLHYIYLGDILCTSYSLVQEIYNWVNTNDIDNETYLSKLQSGKIKLVIFYLASYSKSLANVYAQLRININKNFDRCYDIYSVIENENYNGAKIDIIIPTEENQPDFVFKYQAKIEKEVDIYCERRNIPNNSFDFFRQPELLIEELFTSALTRKRFEDIVLQYGIKILKETGHYEQGLRALGDTLPSHKNFGFGALVMTWFNISKSCPLVFWYASKSYTPLFNID